MPLKARILRRYEYNDLPSSDSIRLLELLPGSGVQPLICHVVIADLNQKPLYEAISYVWGKRQYRGKIACDGKLLSITMSLQEALRRFRDEKKTRVLWADAICINQKDDEERSRQVRLMDKIYAFASCVLVWLGPDEKGDAQETFSLVREMNQFYNDQRKVHGSVNGVTRLRHDELDQCNIKRWESLSKMMRSQWFTRVWVIQEVGCASRATLFMGQSEIPWNELMELFSWLYLRAMYGGTAHYIETEPIDGTVHYFAIESILYTWLSYDTTRDILDILTVGSKRIPSFLEVLDSVRERKCSDSRDRICAFLSHPILQRGKTGPIIKPSYERGDPSAVKVYYDFAIKWLKHYENAYLLSYVFHLNSTTIYEEFPSFVPQWNCDNPTEILNPAPQRNGYNATRSSFFSANELRGCLLSVHGMEFDTVEFCSARLDWDENRRHLQSLGFLEIWKALFRENKARLMIYQDEHRAFALTLTAGQLNEYSGNGKLPNEFLEKHFVSFSEYWLRRFVGQPDCDIPNTIKQAAKPGSDDSFARTSSYMCNFRKFFRTRNGYFGLGPSIIQNGDLCCLFFGAEVPYILRPCEDDAFKFIGECYLHGIMYGEAMDMLKNGDLKKTEFILQ
jgi:Heterokaryon incompatibility protein (HET)